MEKQICPECGAPIAQNEQVKSCPECGCPLSQCELPSANSVADIKAEKSECAKSEGEKSIDAEVEKIGCYKAWRKYRRGEYNISSLLTIFCMVLVISAIGLGIGFLIYFIVRGVQIDNALLFFLEFRTKTLKFTATIAVLAAVGVILDIISDCYDLIKLSAWLRANNVDMTTCGEVLAYGSVSKKKQSAYLDAIKLAYCTTYSDNVNRFVIANIVECIIIAVFFIATGILSAIAINAIIANSAGLYGIAYPTGFTIGAFVSAGMPELLRSIINKYVSAPAKEWALSISH